MGILETRNLDFRNVIILSMSDDNFPGNLAGASSFIPYNLRMAYGMPTPEHHESVYAYYFYRLIQRAERVDMLYCSHADEKSTGEQSRYIYQLDYESPYPIARTNVGVDVTVADESDEEKPKNERVMTLLQRFLDAKDEKALLSPTALARYVVCPMKFYFASVARIKVSDELTEEVDNPMFGIILHDAMRRLYAPIEGAANPKALIERMISSGAVEKAVAESINENYLNNSNADQKEYSGSLLLVREIITKYIRRGILRYDADHDSFAVMSNEQRVVYPFPLGDGRTVKVGGIADRIDSLDSGDLRVVDYKTGSLHLEFGGVESLFEGESRQSLGNLLQTMIYSMVLYHNFSRNVQPALYFARYIHNDDYSPRLMDKQRGAEVDYASYAEEFEQLLGERLRELFDRRIPFRRCGKEEADKVCKYCDFKVICKR